MVIATTKEVTLLPNQTATMTSGWKKSHTEIYMYIICAYCIGISHFGMKRANIEKSWRANKIKLYLQSFCRKHVG